MNTAQYLRAYSRKEACVTLGISKSTLDTLIREGRLPVVRLKRRVLIPAETIAQFLAVGKPSHVAPPATPAAADTAHGGGQA